MVMEEVMATPSLVESTTTPTESMVMEVEGGNGNAIVGRIDNNNRNGGDGNDSNNVGG